MYDRVHGTCECAVVNWELFYISLYPHLTEGRLYYAL